MSWWNNSPETKLSDDEVHLQNRYPKHIARAFIAVNYDEGMPFLEKEWHYRPHYELAAEAIESFAQRWGGMDNEVFVRVLQQATGRDRLVAIFALGQSEFPQAADLLVPFLTSADLLERCATACALGFKHDERVFPVLEEYFLTDAPAQEIELAQIGPIRRILPEAEIWYSSYRSWMARVLATWGPSSFTAVLRKAFLRMWEIEPQKGGFGPDYDIHDALLYALGRRGALATLHGVALPVQQRRLAMNFLALGYVRADERFADLWLAMVENAELQKEVALVLAKHFALSEQETQECINSFNSDYFGRL